MEVAARTSLSTSTNSLRYSGPLFPSLAQAL